MGRQPRSITTWPFSPSIYSHVTSESLLQEHTLHMSVIGSALPPTGSSCILIAPTLTLKHSLVFQPSCCGHCSVRTNKQKCHVLDCNRFVKYLRKGMKRKTSGNKEVGGRAGASNHWWSQPWACAEGKTRLLSADSPLPRMVSPSMARVIHGQLQCETLNQKKCQN